MTPTLMFSKLSIFMLNSHHFDQILACNPLHFVGFENKFQLPRSSVFAEKPVWHILSKKKKKMNAPPSLKCPSCDLAVAHEACTIPRGSWISCNTTLSFNSSEVGLYLPSLHGICTQPILAFPT